jgi:uncharacterized membrane protein YfcA
MDSAVYLLAAGVAFVIAFVSATAGVTGAFLLIPFQISVLGFAAPSATATNHLFNVIAAPGGFASYWRQQRLVRPLAAVLVAGTLPGIAAGIALRIRYLPEPSRFRPFAGSVLVLLGLSLLVRSLTGRRRDSLRSAPAGSITGVRLGWTRLTLAFDGKTHAVGVPQLLLYCLCVGVVGGAYGVGGGVFTSAYLVGICGLPVYASAGATLLSTFAASCFAALGFTFVRGSGAPTSPLWLLGIAMGIGGLVGGYLGARAQRRLPSLLIRVVLSLLMLVLGLGYLLA